MKKEVVNIYTNQSLRNLVLALSILKHIFSSVDVGDKLDSVYSRTDDLEILNKSLMVATYLTGIFNSRICIHLIRPHHPTPFSMPCIYHMIDKCKYS